MKRLKSMICRLLPVLLAAFLAGLSAAGCGHFSDSVQPGQAGASETAVTADIAQLPLPGLPEAFALSMVPDYSGSIWADINEDVPFFDEKQMEAARRLTAILSSQETMDSAGKPEEQPNQEQPNQNREDQKMAGQKPAERQGKGSFQTYQIYGNLDALGRCTGACALVGPETLPQEERGQIGMIKPTGWHTVKYDGIDGNYLYNRCHLIGFQLTGQDANEKNLITGTRAMNVEGMLPYEDSVLAYVRGTGRHVLYRVTPVFLQDNLLADGVLMEARSVEDPLVQFCAFCYNVQPGIRIDYATGESRVDDRSPQEIPEKQAVSEWKYIVNVSSRKFHRPGCESVQEMSRKNRQGFNGSREELIRMGYEACKNCNP